MSYSFSFPHSFLLQAKPNMTPAQQAQFDQQKTQLIQRMSPTAQQAAMRMDQMEQQVRMKENQESSPEVEKSSE